MSSRSIRQPTSSGSRRWTACRVLPRTCAGRARPCTPSGPWTIRQYAGFSTAEQSNAFYRRNLAGRSDRAFGRVRSRDPSGLRQRPSAGRGRRRQGGRRDRHGRGHEDPVRRDPAGPGQRLDDHERRGAAGARLLHRRGRGAGRGARGAGRHDPERHPEGVHGPQHLHLSASTLDADRGRRDRLCSRADAALQPDLDLRLPHAGGGCDPGPGARLHARRRARVRARGGRARARDRRVRAQALLLLRHRHELLHGGRKAQGGALPLGEADRARVRAQGPALADAAHALPDERRLAAGPGRRQQRRPDHARGAGGGLGRDPVAAHQRVRRGPRSADRSLGPDRAQHAIDPGRGDRDPPCRRPARRQLLRRAPDREPDRGGRGADRGGRGDGRHDQSDRGRHAQGADRGRGRPPPGGLGPRRGGRGRGQPVPAGRGPAGRAARHRH